MVSLERSSGSSRSILRFPCEEDPRIGSSKIPTVDLEGEIGLNMGWNEDIFGRRGFLMGYKEDERFRSSKRGPHDGLWIVQRWQWTHNVRTV